MKKMDRMNLILLLVMSLFPFKKRKSVSNRLKSNPVERTTTAQSSEYKALAEQKRQRRCERNLKLKAKQEL